MCVADLSSPDRIIAEARRWLGTPYQHQASLCGVGADCLGLVRGLYRALYGYEPETPPAYARAARCGEREELQIAALRHLVQVNNIEMEDIEAGCVLLFRMRRSLPARHLAIYLGNGNILHAMSGVGVCEIDFTQWWQSRCVGVFAFPQKIISEKPNE